MHSSWETKGFLSEKHLLEVLSSKKKLFNCKISKYVVLFRYKRFVHFILEDKLLYQLEYKTPSDTSFLKLVDRGGLIEKKEKKRTC